MKKYLFDTSALIFALGIDKRARSLQDMIDEHEVYVSVVNLWEISIKLEKGKLSLNLSLEELTEKCEHALTGIVSIDPPDIHKYRDLMKKTKHRDPFDLMLIAQAQSRGLSLVTSDEILLNDFKKFTKSILV